MKKYKLVIQSFNVSTSIYIDLSPSEAKLMNDINASLVKQKAENIISIEEAE